jgi:lipopolysaccharide/colanic/teichoic acid biosynthesis glycosyltransferase
MQLTAALMDEYRNKEEPADVASTTEMAGRVPGAEWLEEHAARVAASRYLRWVKPAIERTFAAALCVALLPLMIVITAVLRITLGRHTVLTQQRVGLHGRPFAMYKFRTMLHDRRVSGRPVSVEQRVCHKREDDPRHTRVGKFLRGTSLDELPQLWNIVKGDMALVGPRPELVEIVRQYEPWQHCRHVVRPGLTGLWQVSGRNSGDLMHMHTEVDLEFVRTVSFRTDMRILGNTLYKMTTGRLRGA